jgi:hypothetical protein
MRQLIDERFTASSLLGLSRSSVDDEDDRTTINSSGAESPTLLPSSSVCGNYYEKIIAENHWLKDANGNPFTHLQVQPKRVRRSGKFTKEERELIR